MELYTFLREFADSWALVGMALICAVIVAMLFRPGSRRMHADAANIPFRDDTIDREPLVAPAKEDAK